MELLQNMLITAVVFIFILGLLVLVHELGHFMVARRFGVACDEFGIGFPPRLAGFYKRNGKWVRVLGSREITDHDSTVYSLNWIPLGGFVKIKGENDNGNHDADSLGAQKPWKRALILSAGVLMNVVLAWVILSIAMMIGLPEVVRDSAIDPNYVKDRRIQITQVLADRPAEQAGIIMGDVIVSVDGQVFDKISGLIDYIGAKKDVAINFELKRGHSGISQTVTPTEIVDFDETTGQSKTRIGIGVAIDEIATVRYPWYQAIYQGLMAVFLLLWMILSGIVNLIIQLFQGKADGNSVAGPIGIATITGQMVNLGVVYVMQFTAALSLNLAVINILPIPALDGGRLMFLAIEKIRGKAMKPQLEAIFNNVFFFALILLILVVTIKDISKLGCLSCQLQNLFK